MSDVSKWVNAAAALQSQMTRARINAFVLMLVLCYFNAIWSAFFTFVYISWFHDILMLSGTLVWQIWSGKGGKKDKTNGKPVEKGVSATDL